MENTDEIWKDEFEWKIPNMSNIRKFNIREELKSVEFKFGKYDCFLSIVNDSHEMDEFMCYDVWLNKSGQKEVSCKGFCKLSLINGSGEEFFVTKRTALKFNEKFRLMKIMDSDLCCEENHLVPEDVLTLRLSWCHVGDSIWEQNSRTISDFNSEKEPSKLLQKLSKDFLHLYANKEGTEDFFLRVRETKIPVHRAVLSARSEYFANIFHQDTWKNRSNDVIDILDVDANVLNDVVYYVYSGKIREMSANTVIPMYGVARKFALIELRDECVDVLVGSLTVENVCDAALLADSHGETELVEKLVQFVNKKWEEIEQTQKWRELKKSEPALAHKLRNSNLMI